MFLLSKKIIFDMSVSINNLDFTFCKKFLYRKYFINAHCHYLFCFVTFEEEGVRYVALFEGEMGFKTMKNLVMLSIYGPLPL